MFIKNTTQEALEKALDIINKKHFNGNIKADIQSVNNKNTRFKVRFGVNNSRAKGGRIGFSGRRVASACWHAFGYYFDELLAITEKAEVRAGNKIINSNGGNWQDWNIGSMVEPMYYSEACDCEA